MQSQLEIVLEEISVQIEGFLEMEIGRLQDLYVAHTNCEETDEEKVTRRRQEREEGGATTDDLLDAVVQRISALETAASTQTRLRKQLCQREVAVVNVRY